MKLARSSETSAHLYETTRRHNLEDLNLQERGIEKLIYQVEKHVFSPGTEPRYQDQRIALLRPPITYISAVCAKVSTQ
jgi:hypothetical protein